MSWSEMVPRGSRALSLFRTLGTAVLLTVAPMLQSTEPDGAGSPERAAHGWLRAIGRLEVPSIRHMDGSSRHYREDCSGTLVSAGGTGAADSIITAWHCIEYYTDLSRPIRFTLRTDSGEIISRLAYRLGDGDGMHNDWAIMRLQRPVPAAMAPSLRLHPAREDAHLPVTMAGYSRMPGDTAPASRLSVDAACSITRQAARSSDTDCLARKGASGGAVVQRSAGGEPLLCGVISRGDSEGLSIFVPVENFRQAISLYVN